MMEAHKRGLTCFHDFLEVTTIEDFVTDWTLHFAEDWLFYGLVALYGEFYTELHFSGVYAWSIYEFFYG